MNKHILHLIIGVSINLFFTIQSFGQGHTPYSWEENRQLIELTNAEKEFPLYVIQRDEVNEFVYENNDLICYITNHSIIRANNNEALSSSNKIYIPMKDAMELTDVKVRVIKKDGSTINFNKKNIKELEDKETGYKILAVEGAEVGSEIEFFYTRKIDASTFLTRYIQNSYPIGSYDFVLKCPDNLEYEFKTYNTNTNVVQTDTTKAYNEYHLHINNIAALHEEAFSAYENSKIRLEAKLAYNTASGKSRLNTWGDAGKRIYDLIYSLSSQEQKEINRFLKEHRYEGSPIDMFRQYEHYIKTNYYYEENLGESGSNVSFLLKNKYGSDRAFTKLYAAILNSLNIEHEVVLTSDRFREKFDPDFDSWNYLDDYFIYLNDVDMFLDPKNAALRLGTIQSNYVSTSALFINPEQIQNFIYPVAHISNIPEPSYMSNFDNLTVDVSFSDNRESNTVSVTRSFGGYNAEFYKTAMLIADTERKKEIIDEVIKYLAQDADIQNIEVTKANNTYDTWNNPFVVKGDFSTKSYIESAGNVILFKAGELIGPQSELYQEDKRETEIVNDFNRGYFRKIKINLPENYEVQNPEDLIINDEVVEKDKVIYSFASSYKINGSEIEIEIEEFYDMIYYPVEKFEPFRKVINAAADWNKIVLVLKEK